MDSYRQIIQQTLLRYAAIRPSHGDIRLEVVFDEQRDRYALMQVGWDRGRRVRGNVVYIVLAANKVQIEYDGLEASIADELAEQGIPMADIVLAYLPAQKILPLAA